MCSGKLKKIMVMIWQEKKDDSNYLYEFELLKNHTKHQ
jgi:hypothetical protein